MRASINLSLDIIILLYVTLLTVGGHEEKVAGYRFEYKQRNKARGKRFTTNQLLMTAVASDEHSRTRVGSRWYGSDAE